MVNNIEFMRFLEEAYWWKIDSFTELDDFSIMIDLIRLKIIDQSVPPLEDGFPPRVEDRRFRLYRIALDSGYNPPKEYLSEEFAKRCCEEFDQLGYPVMVTWQGKDDSRNPMDWLTAVRTKDHAVLINARDRIILDMVKAFAIAFNRNHTGAWELLLAENKWRYDDGGFSYAHNYSGEGVPDRQDLAVRLVQMHAQLGDVTAGLFREENGVCVPMVMNMETRNGYSFRVPYDEIVQISLRNFPEETPVTLLSKGKRMDTLVPETIYDIVGWVVQSSETFVIDVDIVANPIDSPTTQKRYRFPVGDLREALRGEPISVLLCQSLDIRSTEKERDSKRVLVHNKEKLERFWTEKIFCNPWIDTHGGLAFLNGARFSASWIVAKGSIVEDSEFQIL